MPMPHELLLQFLAAAATFIAAFSAFLVSATFIRVVIVMAVRRLLRGARDQVVERFGSLRDGALLLSWRSYQDAVEASMLEAAFAAFHKARAARARLEAWRRFHDTFRRMFDSGSPDDPVPEKAKEFAAFETQRLIRAAEYLSERLARGAVPVKPFLDFLTEERAAALRDPESFRGHAGRFRDRFGFCPFRLMKYLDEADEPPA